MFGPFNLGEFWYGLEAFKYCPEHPENEKEIPELCLPFYFGHGFKFGKCWCFPKDIRFAIRNVNDNHGKK